MNAFKSTLMKFASLLADRAGYLIIPQWRLDEWMHVDLLTRLLKHMNIDCVVDVGANRGQFGDLLRHKIGFQGLILSFEPVHHVAELCKERAATDVNWHVFQMALGNKSGSAVINVMEETAFNSFLEPIGGVERERIKGNRVVATELAPIATLDEILPQLKVDHRFNNIFLKIDTQGFDLYVIEGAKSALSSIAVLQTELSVIPIYQGMPNWIDAASMLQEKGFQIAGLFPVNRDRSSRVVEFDGIFIKEPE